MVSPYNKNDNMEEKIKIAQSAAVLVKNNVVLGLGSGSTMELFIEALAARKYTENLEFRCVASSNKILEKALQFGFEFKEISEISTIHQAFDGADRIDEFGNLIKGGGGSLFRERQVLLMAEKKYILADQFKYVSSFEKEIIPIEVVPFNVQYTINQVEAKGFRCILREIHGAPFVTDNENFIVDAVYTGNQNINKAYMELKMLFGIVEVGIFLNDDYKFI